MAKSKKKSKTRSRKPVPKSAAKKKAASKKARPGKASGPASKTKSIAKSKSRARVASPAGAHDGVLQRIFDRVKPIFRKPLDPRIKHLVEVFGVEAVSGLIDAARRKIDAAHRDELVATLNAMEGRPAPHAHGSWAWHELMTSDTAAAKRFYRDMFGWQASDVEMMPGFHYTTFSNNGTDVGGMMAIGPEHGDMRPGWGVYVAVQDVDSAADKAEALGGEIIVPAHDIPVGRWAMVRDPTGAVICLYCAKM